MRTTQPPALAGEIAGRGRIVLREATTADAAGLARLSGLADRRLPVGPLLLAEVDGELLAARGAGGDTIGDPFHATADLFDLLALRSRHLESAAA